MRISRLFLAGATVVGSLSVGLVATAQSEDEPLAELSWSDQAARGDSVNFSSVAFGDGRVAAVGVNSANAGQIQVVQYDAAGNASAGTVAGTGATLFEPRGIATYGDNTVVQFASSAGLTIARLAGTTKVWAANDSLGSCGGGDGEVVDVAVAPDGSVYSAAWNYRGNAPAGCDGTGVRKYNSGGGRINGWGASFENTFYDNRLESQAITVGSDGNVYIAGVVFDGINGLPERVGVIKINAGGTRVNGYGEDNGLASFSAGVLPDFWGFEPGFSRAAGSTGALDATVDSQGRVLLVGAGRRASGGNGTTDVWVARLNASGQLDGSFGNGGITYLDINGGFDYGLRIAVDSQNRPVIGGVTNSGAFSSANDSRSEFTARFTASGTPESATIRVTPRGGSRYMLQSVAVGGGKVVSSGALRDAGQGFITINPLPGSGSGGSGSAAGQLFTGSTPWRAVDTRDTASPLTALEPRAVAVAGVPGGAPGDAVAVALNVTVADPSEGGYLTIYPGGAPPTASTLNFSAGQTIANAIVVGIDPGGTVNAVLGAGSAHLIVDVMGWFGPNQNYVPASPVRAIDTRNTVALGPFETRTVDVAGLNGAPGAGSAKAVTLNITAVDPTSGGHLRAWPGTGEAPYASILNFGAFQTVANGTTLGVVNGQITVGNFSNGTVHLVIDVTGTFTNAAAFNPITPVRAYDSRDSAAFGEFEQRSLKVTGLGGVPDSGVRGVVVNVTVTGPTSAGYFSVFPTGSAVPNSSLLNFTPGVDIANSVVMGVGNNGSIDLLNSLGATHAIVDVVGWF